MTSIINQQTQSNQLISNLNEMCKALFNSVDKNAFKYLDELAFLDESKFKTGIELELIGNNIYEGVIGIAISILIGIALYYIVNYFIRKIINEEMENPYTFIIKSIIAGFFIIYIKDIVLFVISVNNIITKEILNLTQTFFNQKVTFENILIKINETLYVQGEGFNVMSFDGIIKIYLVFGIINLIFEYSLRYVMIKIMFILSPIFYVMIKIMFILSPIFVAFKTNRKTEYLYNNWIKGIFSLLFMQNIIAIILVISTRFITSPLIPINKIIYIGMIYALIKVNVFIKEIFGGVSIEVQTPIKNIIR